MAKQQTRTSGGAYQNPTEGIVDYGAFNRGLQAGLKPGLDFLKEQEKEEPTYEDIELINVDAKYSEGGEYGLDEGTSKKINDSIKTAAEGLKYQTNPKTGKKTIIDFNNKNSDGTKRAELLLKTGKGINVLFESGLKNSEVVDFLHQAPVIGKNKNGQKITYNSILNTNFQKLALKENRKGTEGADFSVEFREVDGVMTGGVVMGGYFIRTDDLTPETISKWLPPKDDTDGSIEDHFSKIGKNIKPITKTVKTQVTTTKNGIETTSTKDKSIITKDSYTSIDTTTLNAANKIIRDSDATFNAIYRNILYGVGSKKSDTSYINSPKFKNGFTYASKVYNVEEFFKINKENGTLGNVPDQVKNALAIQYTQDKYKVNQFPSAYVSDEYGHPRKTRDLVDETTKTSETTDKVSTVSSVQDIVNILPKREKVEGSLTRANVLGGKALYYTQNAGQQRNLVNTMNLVIKPGPDSKFYTPQEAKDIFFNERRSQKNDEKERLYTDDDIKEEWSNKVAKGVFTKNNSKLPAPMWRLKSGQLEPVILDANPYSVFNYITDNVITNPEKALKVKNEYKRMIEGNNRKQLP